MKFAYTLISAVLLGLVACEAATSTPNADPMLRIIQPEEDSTFTLGDEVTFEVQAEDRDGTISKVEFYVDSEVVSTKTAAPYRYTFVAQDPGEFQLSARAFDDAERSVQKSVTISVGSESSSILTLGVSGPGRVSGSAGIDCSETCTYTLPQGQLTLNAQPEPGAQFEGWEGCEDAGASCTLDLRGDTSVRASFTAAGLAIKPAEAALAAGQSQQFEVQGASSDVLWSASGGTLTPNGAKATFTAPAQPGIYQVSASSSGSEVTATVEVSAASGLTPFSIVALPDTQSYLCYGGDGDGCGNKDERFVAGFDAQTRWIAENQAAENIAFVTHLGDVVDVAKLENVTDPLTGQELEPFAEWVEADKVMDRLDGVVPYSVAMGDHDYGPEEHHDGDTEGYETYFGPERYESYNWYGGAADNGLSHYQIVTMGGVSFLHLALEWEAPSAALSWAQSVLDANATLPTIISTHAYLIDGNDAGHSRSTEACINTIGKCDDPGNAPDASSGKDIYEQLVKPNPQIFMVLNGHFHNNGRRNSDCEAGFFACNNGEYRQVSTNDAGTKVYEMLSNYQDYDNGGDSWLRVIRFLPGEGEGGLDRIKVGTYSPTLDTVQTGAASDFFFDLDFKERFGLNEGF